jgi:hypothetical protein
MHYCCSSMDSADMPVVHCWGCTKLILVPCLDDKPAEMFKVGFRCCTAWTAPHCPSLPLTHCL